METCAIPIMIIMLVLGLLGLRQLPARTLRTLRDTAAQTCTVQTAQQGITVHVGPGYNRGIRDYLAPDQPFTVIGQATADDGSLWWQIEIPGVDQAWVAAEDVKQIGGCVMVVDADAPPFVPAAPPAPSGDVVSFPVYNCVYLGSGQFEWYSADVTYDDNGAVIDETITGGPFQGQWQPQCPAGDQPGDSGSGDPGPAPTNVPPPTATPGGSTLGGGTTGDGE